MRIEATLVEAHGPD
ncbi:hypothetical protein CGLO_17258 [Colletotrichum gloeosporioides Cg-14]|uniref:Uncharacterized protein n=1 Tax=Colletotrichum gloeosporioides (strain Cg-14) TaxID=1237896 RepID=T0JU31_COLGC|nr:hypothetical protein CGLO_17258 [Colletotrichum gloeosporioides Cg-14]